MPKAALRRASLIAADTLIYLSYASLWVCLASTAASVVGRRACGDRSPAVSAAWVVTQYAALLALPLFPFAVLLSSLRAVFPKNNDAEEEVKDGQDVEKLPRSVHLLQELMWNLWKMRKDPTIRGALALLPFMLLMLAGLGMESSSSCISSILIDVGLVGADAVCCFIILPTTVLRVWRMK